MANKLPYPCTIVQDRYTGTYSGGKWTAFNLDPDEIPTAINDSDVPCATFWARNNLAVGLGDTPNEALENLTNKLKEWE